MEDSINAFAEILRRPGAASGPMAGATFAAKDLFDVAGHVTGCGNPEWARTHDAAMETAPAIDAILGAGAEFVGKTHTDELAYSLMGVNAHYGTPVNTADPRRVPGGSSSGSAAAVAAGLVDMALGTDTGGSVRIPASFCGIWGLRTTFGLLSVEGVMPFTHSFDTVGWFARDETLMTQTAEALGVPNAAPIRSLVIPVDAWARADAGVVEALTPSISRLQDLLGPVIPVRLAPDGLEAWREVFRICQAWEVWDILGDWVSSHDPDFGPGTRERFKMASEIDRESFVAADRQREEIGKRVADIAGPDAAMVMPTSPAAAPFLDAGTAELDNFRARALEMLCPAGLSGLPQLSVPAGKVDRGPVGISLVGPRNHDMSLLLLARQAGLGR